MTYAAVGHPGNLRWLTHENASGAARPSIKLRPSTGIASTVRCFHSRSCGLDILARRYHHGNCSAFRSLGLGPYHRPLQAALSGSLNKAPGFAGGYLLSDSDLMVVERFELALAPPALCKGTGGVQCGQDTNVTDLSRLTVGARSLAPI